VADRWTSSRVEGEYSNELPIHKFSLNSNHSMFAQKMVASNKDVLMNLRTNFDKPDLMKELYRKLQRMLSLRVLRQLFRLVFKMFYFVDVENMLQRMTIIGMILRFRQLTQEALHDALIDRIPFLLSSILDFHDHAPNGESAVSRWRTSSNPFILKCHCLLECRRNGFSCWNCAQSRPDVGFCIAKPEKR